MQEKEIQVYEQMLGANGKGLPPALVEAHRRARFAADRLQSPPFGVRDLLMIALYAGALPDRPQTRSETEDAEVAAVDHVTDAEVDAGAEFALTARGKQRLANAAKK